MVIGKIKVTGTRAYTTEAQDIPQGIVGAEVAFDFSADWAGLTKNVVFVGAKDVEILDIQDSVYLPPEVVSTTNINVRVGVVGLDANKKLVIPTLWADLGTVKPAAPVDMGYDPTLPIWAQLMGMIGDLRGLKTEAKENLVAAINELALSPEELQKIIEDALTKAKESGEFDGKDGQDGYTPQKGIDYFDGKDGHPGKDGVDGKDGAPGKSAYQYAKEGGFTGTEEEFAQKLASESGGGLPLPPAAAVGQFICVSAVDENGKVTATEAVDAPKGEVLTDAEGVAF